MDEERVRKADPSDDLSHDEYRCQGCGQWRAVMQGSGDHVFCDDCWVFWQQVGERLALSTLGAEACRGKIGLHVVRPTGAPP